MFQLTSVRVLSDVVVIFLGLNRNIKSKRQFLGCATFAVSARIFSAKLHLKAQGIF